MDVAELRELVDKVDELLYLRDWFKKLKTADGQVQLQDAILATNTGLEEFHRASAWARGIRVRAAAQVGRVRAGVAGTGAVVEPRQVFAVAQVLAPLNRGLIEVEEFTTSISPRRGTPYSGS